MTNIITTDSVKKGKQLSDIMVFGATAITLLVITLYNPLVTPEEPPPQVLMIFTMIVILIWAMTIITHVTYENEKTRQSFQNSNSVSTNE